MKFSGGNGAVGGHPSNEAPSRRTKMIGWKIHHVHEDAVPIYIEHGGFSD